LRKREPLERREALPDARSPLLGCRRFGRARRAIAKQHLQRRDEGDDDALRPDARLGDARACRRSSCRLALDAEGAAREGAFTSTTGPATETVSAISAPRKRRTSLGRHDLVADASMTTSW
jgi:hypothetical protein